MGGGRYTAGLEEHEHEDLKGGKEQKEVELPSGCCERELLQQC